MRDSLSTIEIRLPHDKPAWAAYTTLAITVALLAAELFGFIHALGRILGRLP